MAMGPGGGDIPLLGTVFHWLFLLGQNYMHKFYEADVAQPILCLDFFSLYDLAVFPSVPHLRRTALPEFGVLLPNPHRPTPPTLSVPVPKSSSEAQRRPVFGVDVILRDFSVVFCENYSKNIPKHGVVHEIITERPPVSCHLCRLSPEHLQLVKQEFPNMEAMGIIRRSKSPWHSPLHIVEKPNGQIRPCGDFQALNVWTVKGRYSLPPLRDFAANLAGSIVFSVLDLTKANFQIPLLPDAIPKTAIVTPFGYWEYLVLPFGVCNAVSTFQWAVDCIFAGVTFIFCYLDDLLILSLKRKSMSNISATFYNTCVTPGSQSTPPSVSCSSPRSTTWVTDGWIFANRLLAYLTFANQAICQPYLLPTRLVANRDFPNQASCQPDNLPTIYIVLSNGK